MHDDVNAYYKELITFSGRSGKAFRNNSCLNSNLWDGIFAEECWLKSGDTILGRGPELGGKADEKKLYLVFNFTNTYADSIV